jgi:hypothetical protein
MVQRAFADAHDLAALTGHDVLVEGNEVCVTVTPAMDDAACQKAYEAALARRAQGKE